MKNSFECSSLKSELLSDLKRRIIIQRWIIAALTAIIAALAAR